MTKLKCFTLEGEAIRLTAFVDHHGEKHYGVEFLPEFTEKAMPGDKLKKFANALKADVEQWDGVLNRCAGNFTNSTLFKFFDEVNDDQQEDGT